MQKMSFAGGHVLSLVSLLQFTVEICVTA